MPSPFVKELERELSPNQPSLQEGCPSPKDLKHISQITTNIAPSEGELPHDCPLGNDVFQPRLLPDHLLLDGLGAVPQAVVLRGRATGALRAHGRAMGAAGGLGGPLLRHHPHPALQNGPGSAQRVPVHAGLLSAGQLRPYLFDPLPLSIRAGLFEASAWVGGVAIFP